MSMVMDGVAGLAKSIPGGKWLAIGLGVAALSGVAYITLVPKPDPAAQLAKFTAKVEQIDTDIKITSAGEVYPNRKVNVGPKEGGLLAELFVEQGQTVNAGQVVGRMDTTRVINEVAQAQASVASARAQYQRTLNGSRQQEVAQAKAEMRSAESSLRSAKDNFERYTSLYQAGGLTADELNAKRLAYEQAQAAVATNQERLQLLQEGSRREDILAAKADLARAQATLADIQTRFNDLTIRAPFTGVVSQRYAEVGAFVSPTTTAQGVSANSSSILLLIDRLEVLATVAESDIARIKVGQPVLITSSAFPGKEFKGTVRLVAPEAIEENGITQFQVRVSLNDQAAQTLRSGLNVSLSFIAGSLNDILVIPTTAIISKEGKTGVLVPDLKEGPTYKEVTTGQSLGDKTQILKGLKLNDALYSKLPPGVNLEELLGKSNAFR